MKRILFVLLAVGFLAARSISLYAQFETASVLGYVRDSSGAVVSGATVSLVNQETKAQVTAETNAQGAYEFTDVKIGQYQVTAQANGFDPSTTQPFTVTVNARQRVDVALKIGSNTETVTVDAAAASLLETDNSERGQVIGTREVENLPLNGRAYADLAALVPGVRRNILENSTDSQPRRLLQRQRTAQRVQQLPARRSRQQRLRNLKPGLLQSGNSSLARRHLRVPRRNRQL